MFRSKKSVRSLTVALSLIVVLAMLAPAAFAAPEWVHGVTVDDVDPMYIVAPHTVTIDYTLAIVGTQVDSVWVWFGLEDQNGNLVDWEGDVLLPTQIVAPYEFSHNFGVGGVDDGWYDVEVCVMDGDWDRPLFCDTMENAVLVDYGWPWANLDRPEDGAWVTGQTYLLVGEAGDDWLLDETSPAFSYCAITNWTGMWCGWDNDLWVPIGDGATPTPGVPGQWQDNWDSSLVPDDVGVVRFCVEDMVGHEACDWNVVQVNNRYTTWLQPGWNLISTPLLPYDINIAAVLSHLHNPITMESQVIKVVTMAADGTWKKWTPVDTDTDDFTTFEDGKGYWIEMKVEAPLTFVGTWLTVGPVAPPEYPVVEGWNLIGYTHWNRPTSFPPKEAWDYLSSVQVQQLYRYDAYSGVYVAVYNPQHMTLGAGYWLATNADGMIRP
jgi:hypothetical protein